MMPAAPELRMKSSAHATRDQLGNLGAKVEDEDLGMHECVF